MPEAAEKLARRASRAEQSGAHVAFACLVLGAAALGLAGCPDDSGGAQCDQRRVLAVSDDRAAGGPTYILRGAGFELGLPYTLARTDRATPLASVIGDGTTAELLAPAAGGVIVVGDGAAAQRFDVTGTSLWTVGYDAVGAQAALLGDDRLIVADPTVARAVSPDGAVIWERALPSTTTGVSEVVADRAGGAWVVGAFAGGFLPWIADDPADESAALGHFIFRFDGAGDVVAANAWDDASDAGLGWTQALAVTRGDGSTELVLVGGASSGGGAVPALGIDAADGDGPFAIAFDASGALLWSHPLNRGVELAVDADGNLFALSVPASSNSDAGAPPPEMTGLVSSAPSSATTSVVRSLLIERLDASGAPLGIRTAVSVQTTTYGTLTWTSAPTNGGIVVAGQWLAAPQAESDVEECPQPAFAFRAQTQSLLVTPLTVVAR